jgi:hypothetical protein
MNLKEAKLLDVRVEAVTKVVYQARFELLETHVQAFLLMGNYLQKRDRPNIVYNLIGIAYRMALGLGIHRELPQRLS